MLKILILFVTFCLLPVSLFANDVLCKVDEEVLEKINEQVEDLSGCSSGSRSKITPCFTLDIIYKSTFSKESVCADYPKRKPVSIRSFGTSYGSVKISEPRDIIAPEESTTSKIITGIQDTIDLIPVDLDLVDAGLKAVKSINTPKKKECSTPRKRVELEGSWISTNETKKVFFIPGLTKDQYRRLLANIHVKRYSLIINKSTLNTLNYADWDHIDVKKIEEIYLLDLDTGDVIELKNY